MQLAMTHRIRNVDSGAEDGDGVTAFLERGTMRGAINSSRHAAYHRYSGTNQSARQCPGDSFPVTGTIASPDYCDEWFVQRRDSPDCIELARRVRELSKLARVFVRLCCPAQYFQLRTRRRNLKCRHPSLGQAYDYIFRPDTLL